MLQPRPGDPAPSPPSAFDPWVSVTVLMLGLTVIGLVLGGVLAIYDWRTPGAEQPLFFVVLGIFFAALRDAGTPYRGCLYAGLMLTADGIQVLEFNARFGDPEAQVVLPRVEGDLVPALEAAARGELPADPVRWSPRATVGVVLASRGYPGPYPSGALIDGLSRLEPNVLAFHGRTASAPDGYHTAGGRVLTLVALGESLADARDRAYRNVGRVQFEGMTYRTDIAQREMPVEQLVPFPREGAGQGAT